MNKTTKADVRQSIVKGLNDMDHHVVAMFWRDMEYDLYEHMLEMITPEEDEEGIRYSDTVNKIEITTNGIKCALMPHESGENHDN